MKLKFFVALMLVLMFPAVVSAAIAVPEGESSLTVKWGEWASWALAAGAGLVPIVWSFALGLLPGPARFAIKMTQLDQVILRSIQNWVVLNAEKLEGATWTADLKMKAARDIAALALNTGNKFAKEFRASLEDKARARLQEYLDKQGK